MCPSLRWTPQAHVVHQAALLALFLMAQLAHPHLDSTATAGALRYTHISVIGERNSGTNFMKKLLAANLAPAHIVLDRFTQSKHYMQEPPPQKAPHSLVVVCVRNAYDWVLSLHQHKHKCYCCTQRERKDFWRFVADPYNATEYLVDPRNCPNQDLDISRGNKPFRNLMDMRAQKIKNHLNLSEWTGGVNLVRLEDVFTKNDSIRWLVSFTTQYHLTLKPSAACPNGSAACYARVGATNLVVDEGDARSWRTHSASTPQSRARASVYLNRHLLNEPASPYYKYRDKVSVINAMIDREFEAQLGYEIVAVVPPLTKSEGSGRVWGVSLEGEPDGRSGSKAE